MVSVDEWSRAVESVSSASNRWFRVLVGLGVAYFFVRGLIRLGKPVLYAEDGKVFFADAQMGGLGSLLEPHAGYVNFLARTFALVYSPLPFGAVPFMFAATATIVFLLVSVPVLSQRIAWLIPGRIWRATAFVVLCAMPPLVEAYGNLANLITVGAIGLILLGLSDDPRTGRGRIVEIAAVTVLGLNGPAVVMLSPLYLYRWVRSSRTAHSLRMMLAIAATAGIQIAVFLTSTRETAEGGTLGVFLHLASDRVAGVWLFGMYDVFSGGGVTIFDVLAATWIVTALVITVQILRTPAVVCWLVIGLVLAVDTRAYGAELTLGPIPQGRVLIVPIAFLIVLVTAAAARSTRSWVRSVAVGLLVVGLGGMATTSVLIGYPDPSNLDGLQNCWDAGTSQCSTPIYPPGWDVVLTR